MDLWPDGYDTGPITGPIRYLMSAPEAEHYLGIPQATIRTWHHRKLIHPHGLDSRRRPLFDVRDLVDRRDRSHNRDYYRSQKGPRRLRQQPRGDGQPSKEGPT
jgi:hypothetical protein